MIWNVTPPIASGSAFFGAGSPSCTSVLWRFVTCIAKVTGNQRNFMEVLRPRPCVWPNLSNHTSHEQHVYPLLRWHSGLYQLATSWHRRWCSISSTKCRLAVQPPKPTRWHQAASKRFARRPTWGPNWVEDPLASDEVTMQQAYHVCWVSGETSVWAQSWKAKAQSEPFTFKANSWSRQGVNRCSFLSLPLGSQLKTKSGSLPTSAKSSGPKMTLKMPPATSLTDPFIALIQKGCWDLCIMALLECRGK